MKSRNLSALLLISATLPFAGWSQSGGAASSSAGSGNGSATQPSASSSSGNSSATNPSTPPNSRYEETQSGSTGTAATRSTDGSNLSGAPGAPAGTVSGNLASDASSLGANGGIHRVNKDQLDSRLTASSLIGRKVVDQNGKDVGTVKDIGLQAVLPQDLRLGASSQGASSTTGSNSPTMPAQAASDLRGFAQRATGGAAVYVTVGGAFGFGGDVIAVPANQLKRDGDNLKIQMSQEQLKAIAASSDNDRYNNASE